MKLKTGFMLREIAGQWIVVPLGQRTVEFSAIINLSETGAMIWKGLEQGLSTEDIIKSLIEEYDVEESVARKDLDEFLQTLLEKGLCE